MFWGEHGRIHARFHDWTDHRVAADGYNGADWVPGYYADLHSLGATWCPYVHWRLKPFRGTYVNINEEGYRRTWRPTRTTSGTAGRSHRIFFFGGSTMLGAGARHDHTIPSYVARSLAESGFDVDVKNFGAGYYVITQEVITLMRELQRGSIPDLAVFYDGGNEIGTAYENGVAGRIGQEGHRRNEFNLLKDPRRLRNAYLRTFCDRHLWGFDLAAAKLRNKIVGAPDGRHHEQRNADSARLAQDIVRVYEANVRAVQAFLIAGM